MPQCVIGSIDGFQVVIRDGGLCVGHRLQTVQQSMRGEFGFRSEKFLFKSHPPFLRELVDVVEKRKCFGGRERDQHPAARRATHAARDRMTSLAGLNFFELQDFFAKPARQGNDGGNGNEACRDVEYRIQTARRRIHRNVEPFERRGWHRGIIENPPPVGQIQWGVALRCTHGCSLMRIPA